MKKAISYITVFLIACLLVSCQGQLDTPADSTTAETDAPPLTDETYDRTDDEPDPELTLSDVPQSLIDAMEQELGLIDETIKLPYPDNGIPELGISASTEKRIKDPIICRAGDRIGLPLVQGEGEPDAPYVGHLQATSNNNLLCYTNSWGSNSDSEYPIKYRAMASGVTVIALYLRSTENESCHVVAYYPVYILE